nr:unnamed protein product [Digitaria exilis]
MGKTAILRRRPAISPTQPLLCWAWRPSKPALGISPGTGPTRRRQLPPHDGAPPSRRHDRRRLRGQRPGALGDHHGITVALPAMTLPTTASQWPAMARPASSTRQREWRAVWSQTG